VVVGMLVARAGVLVGDGLDLAGRELAGEHNPASFLPLLGQLLGELRVMRLHRKKIPGTLSHVKGQFGAA